ncbi:MAG: ATP-binding protein [Selenomonadales bacterium]|nr:ATP-binding protein [Selenomonadales bacterium]
MSFLEDTQVLQVLRGFNPWWRSGGWANPPPAFRRTAFHRTWRLLTQAQVRRPVFLSGSHRVGKTTILRQLAEALLADGLAPYQLLYVPLDHPVLELTPLNRLIEIYRTQILGGAEQGVLLLDEITHAEDWSAWLKHTALLWPNYRIAACGSVSAEASLQYGGFTTIAVPPLSFAEYAHMRGMAPSVPCALLELPALPRTSQQQLLHSLAMLEPHFLRYLLQGGYPETALLDDTALAHELLREQCVDRVLRHDIARNAGIRNVRDLEKVFVYLCVHAGESLGQEAMARSLQLSRVTLSSYLHALESAQLILPAHQVDHLSHRVPKSRSKYYVADAALRNAVLLRGEDCLSDPNYLASLAEGCLFRHLSTHFSRAVIGYWRTPRRGLELSMAVMLPERPALAAQLKFRERPEILGSDPLLEFAKLHPDTPCFFVTKSSLDYGPYANSARYFRLPAYMLLYMLGLGQG